MKCETCTYNKYGHIVHLCGLCEEDDIRKRIHWWQEGKKKLKDKEKDRKK